MYSKRYERIRSTILTFAVVLITGLATPAFCDTQTLDTLWIQNWDDGWGDWWATNGLWEVGLPSVGPDSVVSGNSCVGTDMDANYPEPKTTSLISPRFVVPDASGNPRLRFWNWFSLNNGDYGQVKVRVVDGETDIVEGNYTWHGQVWTCGSIDLSDYAGLTIEVEFYFYSKKISYYGDVRPGWYIDDVMLITGLFEDVAVLKDFESGFGDWRVFNGTWEWGVPTYGPNGAHSGDYCIGTNLSGNYSEPKSASLISPCFVVPDASENPRLRFWYWFSLNNGDYGQVKVRVVDGETYIVEDNYTWNGQVWTSNVLDLSAYAGLTVEVEFYFYSKKISYYGDVRPGWYIDDVKLDTGPIVFENPEDFESGFGDWRVFNGTWEWGVPTYGPNGAHSGDYCIGTNLSGNYSEPKSASLISPRFVVPDASENPRLRFYNWLDFNNGDSGVVKIRTESGDWEKILGPYTGDSKPWSPSNAYLSNYSGMTIEVGFFFYSKKISYYGDVASGWYIDDIEIRTDLPRITCPEEPIDSMLCSVPGEVCIRLPISNAATVDVGDLYDAVWADNVLCFTADSYGSYDFRVIAENALGADTCDITVNVSEREKSFTTNTDNFIFATTEDAAELPDSQIIYIDSPCEPGAISWAVEELNGVSWLAIDKDFGSNPDSIEISITDPDLAAGVYSALLEFTDLLGDNPPIYVNISLFVESGVDVGDYRADAKAVRIFEIPINYFTVDSLKGYTVPLRYLTSQPENIILDSVTIPNQNKGPVAVVFYDIAHQGFIIHRPVADPPMPDSMDAEMATAWFSLNENAYEETISIETADIVYDEETYSYQFINAADEIIVPAFDAGKIYVEAVPAAPTLISPADETTEVSPPLVLDWNGIDNVNQYHLQIDKSANFTSPKVDFSALPDTTFTRENELEPNSLYYWRIRAHNEIGWGNWSEIREFTTDNTWILSDIKLIDDNGLPKEFALESNYPNPFNPSTNISFSLPRACDNVKLDIYNVLGQKVNTLVNESLSAGSYIARWDGDNSDGRSVGTGIYFYRLTAGEFVETKKMLLLK